MRKHAPQHCSGQSLIESCLAVALISLLLLGLIQVSQLLAAKEVLNHAAARAARARTVGFNNWMILKAARVAAIPNAGAIIEPSVPRGNPALQAIIENGTAGEAWDAGAYNLSPTEQQLLIEQARIPDYMASENQARASWVLDYENWESVRHYLSGPATDERFTMTVWQDVDLAIPFHRTFYDADHVRLAGECEMEHHAGLYLETY